MEQDLKEGNYSKNILPGYAVGVIQESDRRTGKITCGNIQKILTEAPFHSCGIEVKLVQGQVGRVCQIYSGPGPARHSGGF